MEASPMPPYGTAIHQAIVSGDLGRMKQVAAEAEDFVRQSGDVHAALELLKLEIARAQAANS